MSASQADDHRAIRSASGIPFWQSTVFAAAMLVLLTCLVYGPSYRAGFIWDDDLMVTDNPLVKGGWEGLRDIWFTTKFIDYIPLCSTSFWLEWHWWGMNPAGYHVTNVLLHASGVVMLWRVLARLKIPGAWFVAMIFSIHPVGVTSVTWIAERKNTLSFIFYLLSLLLYFQFENQSDARNPGPGRRFYFLSLAAFIAGLLSKTSIVVLPVVLLLCAWWQRGCISRRDFRRTSLFFLAALAFGLMTLSIHHRHDPVRVVELTTDNLLVRSLGGSRAIWFYLAKDLWPLNLTMHYPRWQIDPYSISSYLPGLLVLGLLVLFWCYRRSWGRAGLFGFGYFVVALWPVLGLLNMAFLKLSQVADHFQYIALPGIIALFVGGISYSWNTFVAARLPQMIPQLLAFALMLLLSVLTWQHERIIGHSEVLWRDNIAKNPDSWAARDNLGRILASQGKFQEAEEQCLAAVAANPTSSVVYYNLGNALSYQNKFDQAIRAFSEAVRLAPNDSKSHNNLANTLVKKGRVDEAILHFREAVRCDPNNTEAHASFANALGQQGKNQEAREQYLEALRLNPADWLAHNGIASLLAGDGKIDEALRHFKEAIRLKPDSPEAQANLANVFSIKGELEPAVRHYKEALRLLPDNVLIRTRFGDVLTRQGKKAEAREQYVIAQCQEADNFSKQGQTAEAIVHWRAALKLKLDSFEVANNLAWILATDPNPQDRNGVEAVQLAERACALSGEKASSFLDTLAAAYAEGGRFDDAVTAIKKAIALAETASQTNSLPKFRQRLELYQSHQPYREPK